jgi:protein translocase SecG subunit
LTTCLFFGIFYEALKRLFLFMRYLLITQAVISLLLVVSILLQNRGSGLGSAFGSDFGGYYTKRGIEKFLFYATTVLATAFLAISATNVYFASGIGN